jgi:hypothetical protein
MPLPAPIHVDHLVVADLVLQPAQGMDAEGVVADAPFRLLGDLDLGDQAAGRRIPPGELDADTEHPGDDTTLVGEPDEGGGQDETASIPIPRARRWARIAREE